MESPEFRFLSPMYVFAVRSWAKLISVTGTLVGASIAVIKHCGQKELTEKRVNFILQFVVHHKSGQKLGQGRNLDTETHAETTEGCCLLTCSHGLFSLFSYIIQDDPPRGEHCPL